MRSLPLLSAALCLLALPLRAGEPLHLKSPSATTADRLTEDAYPRRLAAGRAHAIVRFREASKPRLADLERLGLKALRYVPNSGYLVSVPDGALIEGAEIASVVRLEPENKLSPLLPTGTGSAAFVVEFHPDVDPGAAQDLVRGHLLTARSHPDLLPNHLLVEGPVQFARTLADWDEVAYVFPASRELVEGRRADGCPGAAYPEGTVGQYVAEVGPGWVPSGTGAVELGIHFPDTPGQLPGSSKSEILRALAEWSRYVKLDFVQSPDASSPASVDVLFAAREHGDGHPFDGRGNVLAHAYYPAPPNPEPIAGDIHFDDEEPWGDGEGGTIDLFSIALHEAGHALGLGHSDNPQAVMYPYYHRSTSLMQEDIEAIRQMYPARANDGGGGPDTPVPFDPELKLTIESPREPSSSTSESSIAMAGTVEGGTGGIRVEWSTDRGVSGNADGAHRWRISGVPLEPGANAITVNAFDSLGKTATGSRHVTRTAEPEVPELAILSPAAAATVPDASVLATGTASCRTGMPRATWSNSRGGNGTAAGTTRWTAGPIALQAGANTISITAFCAGGASATRLVTVTYSPPPPRKDTVAPSITIASPASRTPSTYGNTISVRGMASDDAGVVRVSWTDSLGNGGTAAGTAYWDTGPIPLREGANTITIRAFDAAGNSSWKTLVVTRRVR